MSHLTNLRIENLECKSWVANEFLDVLTCYDLPEQGLDKLTLSSFRENCFPLEKEVVTRMANMCPHLSELCLISMFDLSEASRL